MRRPSTLPALRLLLLGLLLALAGPAAARTLSLKIARMATPDLQAQELRFVLEESAQGATLALSAARLVVPALGWDGRLDWSCRLEGLVGSESCAGPLAWQGKAGAGFEAALAVRRDAGASVLELVHGQTRLGFTLPLGEEAPLRVELWRVPAGWLAGPLALAWPEGRLREGELDAEIERLPTGRVEARGAVRGLDASLRAQGARLSRATLAASLAWEPAAQGGAIEAVGAMASARLRLERHAWALPPEPVAFRLQASVDGQGRWDLADFDWADAGTLAFAARGHIEPGKAQPLRELELALREASFPRVLERYAGGLLEGSGFEGLRLAGGLRGELRIDEGALARLALEPVRLDVEDAERGFVLRGIDGRFDWVPTGQGEANTLGWQALRLGDIALPAIRARWQVREGVVQQLGTLALPLLGGQAKLRDLVLDPALRGDWLQGSIALDGLGYDSADGTLALAGLVAAGSLRVAGAPESPRLRLQARLDGGAALAGPFYVEFPPTPVDLALDVEPEAGRWRIRDLLWRDPGVLELRARGLLDPAAPWPAPELEAELASGDLAVATARYARSWLATRGYAELAAAGALRIDLALDEAGWRRFAARAQGVAFDDGGGRFAISGLDGAVDWLAQGDAAATTLGWDGVQLFRIPFGPAAARLQSRESGLALVQPLAVDVLGGRFDLKELTILPRSPRGERYAASFTVTALDMLELSSVLGWPPFPGNLSGGVPEIEMAGDVIQLKGGLQAYVFDGKIDISNVVLERPFGVAPSLGADIYLGNLDLEPLTSAFSFGGMSGRLHGSIRGLRLLDWKPVAFDAWLHTEGGGRMSYKAVNDISALGGGGGLSGSLQALAMQVIDSFGYGRLGIRCRLQDEVCRMAGIDPPASADAAGGYTIVEGAGLPRIRIVGHHRQVDWPTLVRRLVEATRGQGPVIQ